MNRGDYRYIWQRPDWPAWRYDAAELALPLARAHVAQGRLFGRLHHTGLPLQDRAMLDALTDDVVKTSEIEGEQLDTLTVRSSIARRLGVDIGALAPTDRRVEGVVDMVLDATREPGLPLTGQRLQAWHAALFPTGRSGLTRIRVGQWRDDAGGPMEVVSGALHRPRVHFEAPPAARVGDEMARFLEWFNAPSLEDPLVKAGLAHLWLVTIHPFDDGNGRIARAVGDLALARADGTPQRYYSLSAQIQRERRDYYDMLERTQKGGLEVTPWLSWFLACLLRALQHADTMLDDVLAKTRFWRQWAGVPMNPRQTLVLNRLLDGFEGKLSTSKWAALARCSTDTALRDIADLVQRGVLTRSAASGRSTRYELVMQPAPPPL